jgi:hypothetical protein
MGSRSWPHCSWVVPGPWDGEQGVTSNRYPPHAPGSWGVCGLMVTVSGVGPESLSCVLGNNGIVVS